MDILRLIKTRRSIRRFKKGGITPAVIKRILEAGRWAPSGLNNQPWAFLILSGKEKNNIAKFSRYSHVIKACSSIILVFLNKKSSYNLEKDLLAIGACIQNMLLYAHSVKLGSCWLGEILNQRARLERFLRVPKNFRLEAAVALGKPLCVPKAIERRQLYSLIIRRGCLQS